MPTVRKSIKYSLSCLLMLALVLPLGWGGHPAVAEIIKVTQVHNERIARGIDYQENHYRDDQGIAGRSKREHILTADLTDPTVQIVAGKAGDKVLKLDTVSGQVARERQKGRNVIAGINGDMFNISQGTMHYGAPQGLQVKDGSLVVGFETLGSGPRYPVFALDKNRKPIIAHVFMDNKLTLVKTHDEKKPAADYPVSIGIDTLNRNNTQIMNDHMILFTPQLADQPQVGFTSEQAANGTLTVLKNMRGYHGSVKLGQEYEAEVVSIGDTSTGPTRISVPEDGMVLASQGIKATWVKEHLSPGDKVRFSFQIKDESGRRLDLDQAVTAWLPLVQNGRALTQADMLEICKNDWDKGSAVINAPDKARTGIGYTRDGKVVALVVDGGGAACSSYGSDLPAMAKRMQELGVEAAVSLDGGGSTQMNTRLFGENDVKLINLPSDSGKERPISNTLLFVSSAPKTNDLKELKVNQDITVFTGTGYAFEVRGQDSNGHPVDLSQSRVEWSLEPVSGTASPSGSIGQDGVFQAGTRPGMFNVWAGVGPVRSRAAVTVVDSVSTLQLTDSGTLALQTGVPKALRLAAYTQQGEPIIINNQAARWTVDPASVASISPEGILLPLSKGNGVVTAQVGERQVALSFVVGLENQVIDGFEIHDVDSYRVDGYVGGRGQISSQQVQEGKRSLRVDYDYDTWARVYNGSINIRRTEDLPDPGYTSSIRPQKLGMWVYGDGQAPWLRATIKDGNGNPHIVNLASRLDWLGWRYVTAAIPADIALPVTLDCFYMVETDKSKSLRGTVYFDDIRFLYH